MNGLIRAELQEIEQATEGKRDWIARAQFVRKEYIQKWKYLFRIADLGNIDKPLTSKILGNPNHKVTQ